MSNPQLIIKIVDRGTNHTNSKGEVSSSKTGHMWFELHSGDGEVSSYGFAPAPGHEGHAFAPGFRYENDNTSYDFNLNDGDYQRSFAITQGQFNTLQAFGREPEDSGFKMNYNGLSNSCIDFTYKALDLIDFVPEGYDGDLWPTHNINNIRALPSADPLDSQLFISKEGGLFLLDNNQKMIIRLFAPEDKINNDKINSLTKDSVSLGGSKILLQDSQGKDVTSISIESADQLTSLKTNMDLAKDSQGNLQFTDKDGNPIAEEDAIYQFEDEDGNSYAAIRDEARVESEEGGVSYSPTSLINQFEERAKAATNFIVNKTQEFVGDYQDYIVQNKELMLGDLLARVALGESLEESMIAVSEVWGVNAIFNNKLISGELSDLFGIDSDFAKGNGLESGHYEYVTDNQGNIAKDTNGEPLVKITNQGEGSITNAEMLNGAKAGLVSFLTTILLSDIRNDDMNSQEYTEAAATAAAIGALTIYIPGVPVGAIMAIIDSSITAVEDRGDLDSQGWQDLGVQTAAAVAAAVVAWAVGAEVGASIGTAIAPGVGTVIGAVVGALVGAILYAPLTDLFTDVFDAQEELYDAIEDTILKMDLSINNVEENAKQAVKAIEDISKAYLIDYPVDLVVATLNLFTGGNFYSGKVYAPGEYSDPYALLQMVAKEDGSGNMIYVLEQDGTLARARDEFDDDIVGSNGNDVLVGGSGSNIIQGRDGNDHIEGRDTDDHLVGGDGNDLIEGGAGDDVIYGFEAETPFNAKFSNILDSISLALATKKVRVVNSFRKYEDVIIDDFVGRYEGKSNEEIDLATDLDDAQKAAVKLNNLIVKAQDDANSVTNEDIIAAVSYLKILSNGQIDIAITIEELNDYDRGQQNDFMDNVVNLVKAYNLQYFKLDSGNIADYYPAQDHDIIHAGSGNDLIYAGDDNDIVYAGSGDDVVMAGDGKDIVYGGVDNDQILAGDGDDIVMGGSGNDILMGENGRDRLYGGEGNDQITGDQGNDILVGGNGNDNIYGGGNDDIVIGGSGIDMLYGDSGFDIISGGDGDDLILGGLGGDQLGGAAGNDMILGEIGDDQITGGDGADTIDGGDGTDIISGDKGNDILAGGNDNDTYIFKVGDGQDEITDIDGELDTLRFIDLNIIDLHFTKSDNDLVISFSDSTDKVTIKDSFSGNILTPTVESLEFTQTGTDGGSSVDLTELAYDFENDEFNYTQINTVADDVTLQNVLLEDTKGVVRSLDNFYHDLQGVDLDVTEQLYANIDYEFYNDIQWRSYKKKRSSFGGHYTVWYKYYEKHINGFNDSDDRLVGNWWDEIINGKSGDDFLYGNNGNDVIYGEDGNDFLEGGYGDDTLHGQSGNDNLEGGSGNDKLNSGSGNDKISTGEGNDEVNASSGNNVIVAEYGNNTITADDGSNVIEAGSGNDEITLGNGNNIVNLGDGDNTLTVGDGNNLIDSGDGSDSINVGDGNNNIRTGAGNDYVNTGYGSNFIDLGDGNDLVIAGNGDNIIYAGDGNDEIFVGSGENTVYLGYGDDKLTIGTGNNIIVSDAGNNIINVSDSPFADTQKSIDDFAGINAQSFNEVALPTYANILTSIRTSYGDDQINVESQDAIISSGAGNDIIEVGNGNHQINLEEGNNILKIGVGDSTVKARDGDNKISIGDGDTDINLGKGDNVIAMGFGDYNLDLKNGDNLINFNAEAQTFNFEYYVQNYGKEILDIGLGIEKNAQRHFEEVGRYKNYNPNQFFDTSLYVATLQGNNIELAEGQAPFDHYLEIGQFTNYQISDQLQDSNNIANIGDGDNVIYGDNGEDILNIGDGNNVINSSGGNDQISLGAGNNIVDTGSGDDFIDVKDGDNEINLASGNDEIVAGSGNNIINTGSGDDVASIANGSNVVNLGDGNDQLVIGDGNNDISLGKGNDILTAGDGDNVIDSGRGDDQVIGGTGNSTYIYSAGDGNDVINESGGLDIIEFKDLRAKDITLSKENNNLKILVKRTGESISITDYFVKDGGTIDILRFSDNYEINLGDIFVGSDESDKVEGKDSDDQALLGGGNDIVLSFGGDDYLNGDDGDDLIFAGDESDILDGGNGNDYLDAGDGDDVLVDGKGNDRMFGGKGQDSFVITKDSKSNDTITDFNINEDVLDLSNFSREFVDLKSIEALHGVNEDKDGNVVLNLGKDQKLTLTNIKLADLAKININFAVATKSGLIGDNNNNILTGTENADEIFSGQGLDILRGNGGNDKFVITKDEGAIDIIEDFKIGEDVIKLDNLSEIDFSQIKLEQKGDDSIATFSSGQKLILREVEKDNLSKSDFEFSQFNGIGQHERYSGNYTIDDSEIIENNAGVNPEKTDYFMSNEASAGFVGSGYDSNNFYNSANVHNQESYTIDVSKEFARAPWIAYIGNTHWQYIGYGWHMKWHNHIMARNNILHARGLGEKIWGQGGDDLVYANDGNDTVWGGSGNDELHGGNHNDTIYGDNGHDYLLGENGNDRLYGGNHNDNLLGGSGNDYLNGGNQDDRLDGGTGNDELHGANGNDYLYGGENNDTLYGGNGSDYLDGGNGDDVVNGGAGKDTVNGGAGNDRLVGESGNDLLDGGIGNDNLRGGTGNDVLFGGEDNDIVDGQDGNDVVYGGTDNDKIYGGNGDDYLDAGYGEDKVYGGNGNDFVIGGYDNKDDLLAGDAGHDKIVAVNGNNVIDGGSGVDQIQGGEGNDIIYGNSGEDIIIGGAGSDIIYGGTNNDLIDGEAGNDHVIAGQGDDAISGSEGDDLLEGGVGNDILSGGTGHDYLDGGEGNDILQSGAGNDIVLGGSGNDELTGGKDNDFLSGESGDDVYHYNLDDGSDIILENSDSGFDIIKFGNDISKSSITLKQDGESLIIGFIDKSETLTIVNQFSEGKSKIEKLEFENGDEVLLSDGNGSPQNAQIINVQGQINFLASQMGSFFMINEDDQIKIPVSGDLLLENINIANGVLAKDEAGENLIFTPDQDFFGLTNLSYELKDSEGNISEYNLTIAINSVNDAPIVNLVEAELNEDSTIIIDVLANSSDIEDGQLSNLEIGIAKHGKVEITQDNKIFYTPNPDYFGTDSFKYSVIDSEGLVTTKTLNIIINNVEDIPVVVDELVIKSSEDQSITIDINDHAFDADGDELIVISTTDPANGTATIDGSQIIYTPNDNYNGSDSFDYVISDGINELIKTINLEISSENDAPIVITSTAEVQEDGVVIIDIIRDVIDSDGDNLIIESISSPANGAAEIIENKIVYVPKDNYFGDDSLIYTISDGNGGYVTKKLDININSVNDAPVVEVSNGEVREDGILTINVLKGSSDIENDDLIVAEVRNVTAGYATIVNNEVIYIPDQNYHGNATLEYIVSDGENEVVKTLSINIESVNDLPVAILTESSLNEDSSINIDVLSFASDIDGDILNIVGVTGPSNGRALIEDGKITYTPDANYFGSDSFDYLISDGNGGLITKTLNLTINNVNDAPEVTIGGEISIKEDDVATINILDNVSDLDGDELSLISATNALNGSLAIENGSIIYTPDENYNGSENIIYTVSDGTVDTINELTINIDSVNDAPIAQNDQINILEDNQVIIDVLDNDFDIEDTLLKRENILLGGALYGTVYLNDDNQVTYKANKNYNGTDKFIYAVKDSQGVFSNIAEVNVDVESVNDAPIIGKDFSDQMIRAGEESEIQISENIFFDVDGDDLAISLRMKNGEDLPEWIRYDSVNKTIVSNATDDNIGVMNLALVADDGQYQKTTEFTLVVKESLQVRNDVRINIVEGSDESDLVVAETGTTDLIFSGDGNDDLVYNIDDIWGEGYIARNSYTGDEIDIGGKIRSYDAFDGGRGGSDTLYLTEGDDSIFLHDLISDNPTISGSRLFGIEIINALGGSDVIDLSSDIFTYGSVSINGSDGNDTLWSNDGNDIINGEGGDDSIIGGRGDDIMSGGEGNDIIKGYDGDDTLIGGIGQDILEGGNGADIFELSGLNDSTLSKPDIIRDFESGIDLIKITNFGLSFGDLTIGSNGEDTFIQAEESDFALQLNGVFNLTEDDFSIA